VTGDGREVDKNSNDHGEIDHPHISSMILESRKVHQMRIVSGRLQFSSAAGFPGDIASSRHLPDCPT
jgi:hypothetical protein